MNVLSSGAWRHKRPFQAHSVPIPLPFPGRLCNLNNFMPKSSTIVRVHCLAVFASIATIAMTSRRAFVLIGTSNATTCLCNLLYLNNFMMSKSSTVLCVHCLAVLASIATIAMTSRRADVLIGTSNATTCLCNLLYLNNFMPKSSTIDRVHCLAVFASIATIAMTSRRAFVLMVTSNTTA